MKLLVNKVDKRMGLGNMSEEAWQVEYFDGKTVTTPSRSVAEFKMGMKIYVGSHCLEITK